MWRPSVESQWKDDPRIDEARRAPGWRHFHSVCGRAGFYFDRMVRRGRGYACDCFDRRGLIVTGVGATVLEAIRDAHERCGRGTAETRGALRRMVGVADDFEELLR